MAVAIDALASSDAHLSTVTSLFLSSTGLTGGTPLLTVGSGANRALVALVVFDLNNPGTVAVTWDVGGTNQVMGQITTLSTTSEGTAQLWGLVAPASGNLKLQVTCTNSAGDIYLDAMSFTGVNQTGGATSFPNSTGAAQTTATASLNITSAIGNYTVSNLGGSDNLSTGTGNQTLLRYDHGGAVVNYAGQYAVGAGTVTHTFVLSGTPSSGGVPYVGTDIAAFVASGSNIPYDPWPQLGPVQAQKRGSVGWTLFVERRRVRRPPPRRLLIPDSRLVLPYRGIIKRAA